MKRLCTLQPPPSSLHLSTTTTTTTTTHSTNTFLLASKKARVLASQYIDKLLLLVLLTNQITDVSYKILFIMHDDDIFDMMSNGTIKDCKVLGCENIILPNEKFYTLSGGRVINCKHCAEKRGWGNVDVWTLKNVQKMNT